MASAHTLPLVYLDGTKYLLLGIASMEYINVVGHI
jgi:hypothetical protein